MFSPNFKHFKTTSTRFSMTASARREQHERNEAEGRMGKCRGMRHCDDGR
uniref:Uncharacterized protein n=1 Tax=Medicago truncatula TaxID=3880 RepID=Q2HUM4_MEDTR|nr:hypothetical protein MtrDRAFT_AC149130g39v2 [Medicago truncatula]